MVSTIELGDAFMSVSQNRRTAQPALSSRALLTRSRFRFPSTLEIQYSALCPPRSLTRNSFQSLPCQKSPSQKTTTFCRKKTKSGLPGKDETFFLYLNPAFQRVLRRSISWRVSLEPFLFLAEDAATEDGLSP